MKVMLKHGIIKERFSALLTDSIRGQLLEACGYDVNIMEFISLEHTPKNILIKAVRNGRPDRQKYQEYLAFCQGLADPPLPRGRTDAHRTDSERQD